MLERYFGPGWTDYIPGALLLLVQGTLVVVGRFVVADEMIGRALVWLSFVIAVLAVAAIAGAIRKDNMRRGDTR